MIDTDQRAFGRNVEHDPRSRGYAIDIDPTRIKSVAWRCYGPILDQLTTNSCTGHAMAHGVNSKPLHKPGHPLLDHDDALRLYSAATTLDPWPETFHHPPLPDGSTGEDEGSSGLAVAKAARAAGHIDRYEWAFGLDHALAAAQLGTLLVGISWYRGMNTPDADGLVHPTGPYLGGHEVLLTGVLAEPSNRLVRFRNSWGRRWGHGGNFYMTWDDFGTLLDQRGDVLRPIRTT